MDLLVALDRVDTKSHMRSECAGIGTRSGGKAGFKVGNRVAMTNLATFKTLVRCPCQCAVLLPDDIPFSIAAAIPTTFTTAYNSFYGVARTRRGESVLIHSAAGGTGQSAVQTAQHIGAEIYAIVGSDEKKRLLMDSYKIPKHHIFYSRNTSFVQGVKRMTKGREIDVILNSLSGDGLVASWECVAPYGRFVEIGKKDIMDGGKPPMLPSSKSVSFSAVDMTTMGEARPEHLRRTLEEIMGFCIRLSQFKYTLSQISKKLFDTCRLGKQRKFGLNRGQGKSSSADPNLGESSLYCHRRYSTPNLAFICR